MADRIMHGRAASPDGIIYVHAGCKPTNLAEMYSDVMSFDARTSILRKIKTVGEGPGFLARHAMAIMNGYMYTFGGFDGKTWMAGSHRLDLDAKDVGGAARWERLATSGFEPYARTHSCLVPWPQPQPHLLLFGGGDVDTDFSATYTLNTQSLYWQRLTNVSNATISLSQAGCGLLPGTESNEVALAVHGGFGGVEEGHGESGERQSTLRLLRFGSDRWRWTAPRAVHGSTQGRLGHVFEVVNSTCLVVWGGSAGGGGKHLSDLLVAVPNKAVSNVGEDVEGADEVGSNIVDDEGEEVDEFMQDGTDGADGEGDDAHDGNVEDDDAWYEDERNSVRGAPPATSPPAPLRRPAPSTPAHAASSEPASGRQEEVVLRTVRKADKQKKGQARRYRKRARRQIGEQARTTVKEEL